jgi:hypothetical protein
MADSTDPRMVSQRKLKQCLDVLVRAGMDDSLEFQRAFSAGEKHQQPPNT